MRREGGSSSDSLGGVGCTEAGAAAALSPGRQGPLAEHPCLPLWCWGHLEHLFSCSLLWLPGPSSDRDLSAFGLLSGEQAASLAGQEDSHKEFTFGIKHILQGCSCAHPFIFLQ